MNTYRFTEDELRQAVQISTTYVEVLEHLGIPYRGNNYRTVKKAISQFNIDVAHFTGRRVGYESKHKYPIEVYLNNEKKISSWNLIKRLFKSGIKDKKCEICGIDSWNDRPLSLQLHHIDGNHNNNSLSNLIVLCPNCHSQTDNFCGKSNTKKRKVYRCKYCGVEVKTSTCRCRVCALKYKKKNTRVEITKEQLISDLKQFDHNICAIARKYGLSDNAIRGKCHRLGVDFKKR